MSEPVLCILPLPDPVFPRYSPRKTAFAPLLQSLAYYGSASAPDCWSSGTPKYFRNALTSGSAVHPNPTTTAKCMQSVILKAQVAKL